MMKLDDGSLRLSASDLVGHLNCAHLTHQNVAVALGNIAKPYVWDPQLEVLWERGARHEQGYVDHLEGLGLRGLTIGGFQIDTQSVSQTLAAMQQGYDFIAQAALSLGGWAGRADVLLRVEHPSSLGSWSYEVVDTKLAKTTKAGTILQLCLYSELLGEAQGRVPEFMYVVPPWTDFQAERYRLSDYAAYYRRVKGALRATLEQDGGDVPYPEPTEHCDVCNWRVVCDARRRADDHLSLVAGISKSQIVDLKAHDVATMGQLAEMPVPLEWAPERGSVASLERVAQQARVQVEARVLGVRKFELIDFVAGFGFARLPEPSPGDIFLDFEGDSFIGEGGLEYLLGYHFEEAGESEYIGHWAISRGEEKQAFESFVDFVMARREAHPGLHVYHFGGYESGALKRLMGRYATREDELDQILRGAVLVDLLQVVRHAVRASVESYSIKKLEPFYGFERTTGLPDANLALNRLQTNLELGDVAAITPEDYAVVESYNRDDCISTRHLRGWLEQLRSQMIGSGVDIPRPDVPESAPSEQVAAWLARIAPLVEALSKDIPVDPLQRAPEQHARWILANLLGWHRREEKAVWWEYFRLAGLSADDLLDERCAISALAFQGTVGGTAKCPIHRYRFVPQEVDLRAGKALHGVGGTRLGSVDDISLQDLTVDIKKRQDSADSHPEAIFTHELVGSEPMQEALIRLAEFVIANGMEGEGPYQAARDLLMRTAPRLTEDAIVREDGEDALSAALRLSAEIGPGLLPIQGPPGAGKTYTGSRMICELVRQGKKVGVVANSHAVIRNLLDAVIKRAAEQGLPVQCIQKPGEKQEDINCLRFAKNGTDVFAGLASGCDVAGGTAWLWASQDAFESIDVLFIDEAAQLSLANAVAVSQAAQTVVMLGDPQQLDQPTQGTHPDGTGGSALHHILGDEQTISSDRGLFLEETWRLHPRICAFTSELFYEDKLRSRDGLEVQAVASSSDLTGAGLRFAPVEHIGNCNSSREEAQAVAGLVGSLLASGATWIDGDGQERPVTINDVLIIAPYNAQVFEVQKALPGARVGTVDKFQGQEAAIAIYSLTSSSQADAPRGMEFLYSLNRLNVATSRARCLSIIVGSPTVFGAECRTPRQMQLTNAFCRFLELAGS